jgi:hypothetical protein
VVQTLPLGYIAAMMTARANRNILITGGGGDGIAAGIRQMAHAQGARRFINGVESDR